MENLLMTSFKEIDEITAPEKLPPTSLAALDNMRLDQMIGVATIRNGFSRYSQPDTSGVINNLFDVNDINENNYLLANVGPKLRKFFGGTWSDIKTGLTPSKMRMAAYGSQFLFTNGVEKPFYTDLTNTYDTTIDKPDINGITGIVTEGTDVIPFDARYLLVYEIGRASCRERV